MLTLQGIRGILPYATFKQYGMRQTIHEEAYYGAYEYDIGDDRVHEASEIFKEWKGSMQMD